MKVTTKLQDKEEVLIIGRSWNGRAMITEENLETPEWIERVNIWGDCYPEFLKLCLTFETKNTTFLKCKTHVEMIFKTTIS